MHCWVVPSVAAEMWGVPLETILEQVRSGHLPTKTEGGFTFVNVERESSARAQPPLLDDEPRRQTFRVVTTEEVHALTEDFPEFEEELSPEPLTATATLSGDWREGRRLAGALRKRPAR